MVASSSSDVFGTPLRILYATSECAPLVKTGGLGDVAAALPAALRQIGVDARVILPGYRAVLAALPGARSVGWIDAIARLPSAQLLETALPSTDLNTTAACHFSKRGFFTRTALRR